MNLHLSPDHKAAFEYARQQTAYHSKSFFFSARMLPGERRWATYGLYGFCRYADNLIDNPRSRTEQELLQEADMMAQEIRIAYRTGESEHPIVKSFIAVAKQFDIPIEYPLDLIRGVKMDIQRSRYQTFDELYVFCYRVAGVVGLMMTNVLGYKNDAAFHYAEKLGIAMQLTNILRDIQEDAEAGRIYLPQDELQKFGVSEREVEKGIMNENLRSLMEFQVKRAHDYYHEAIPGIKMLRPESRFAIYAAAKIYQGILHQIERRNFNPFLGRVFVSQFKKIGILFSQVLRGRWEGFQETFLPAQVEMVKE
ncbi:MAG: phytoene/squalene synthase family protein [Calditrichia bacterium]